MTQLTFTTFTISEIEIPQELLAVLRDCDGITYVEEQEILDAIENGTVAQFIRELEEGLREAANVGW